MRLTFVVDPLAIRAALAQLTAAPPLAGVSADDRERVQLVLAEALNNIAKHAYAGNPGLVEVTLLRQKSGLVCQIADQGGPMPGGKAPDGKLIDPAKLPLSDLPEGGFGWSMIRTLTLGLTYRRDGDWNRLGFMIPLRR